MVCVSACWFQNCPVSVYYLWDQVFERDWPSDQRGNFLSRSALNVVKSLKRMQTWVQKLSCVSVKWDDVLKMLVAFIQHPKLESNFFFPQTALIFDCASKGCCTFLEIPSTQILDCISPIYRVLCCLGDSSVPLNCPK